MFASVSYGGFGVIMAEIKIKSLDGQEFSAYVAAPAVASGPSVLVVHEIFGVSDGMRAVCDRLAENGYIAVCPDLFWRLEPNMRLSDKNADDVSRGFDLYKHFDMEAGVRDILATIAYMRKMPHCNGSVGVVGYCLGGKLACLAAARSDVECAASYYGVGIDTMLDEFSDIRQPLLLIFVENDKLVSSVAKEKIMAAAKRNPVVQTDVYVGEHAFALPGGPHFDATLAEQADSKVLAFLNEYLHG